MWRPSKLTVFADTFATDEGRDLSITPSILHTGCSAVSGLVEERRSVIASESILMRFGFPPYDTTFTAFRHD